MHFYLYPVLFFLVVSSFGILLVLKFIEILARMRGKDMKSSQAFNITELILLVVLLISVISFAINSVPVFFGR